MEGGGAPGTDLCQVRLLQTEMTGLVPAAVLQARPRSQELHASGQSPGHSSSQQVWRLCVRAFQMGGAIIRAQVCLWITYRYPLHVLSAASRRLGCMLTYRGTAVSLKWVEVGRRVGVSGERFHGITPTKL